MSSPDNGSSEPQERAAIGADFIIPVIACGLALYYFVSTTELVWEARATGTVVGLVLLVLCAVLFVKLGLQVASGKANLGTGELFRNDAFNRQRLGLILMVAAYVVTIYWVGATVGLFFLLIGCMWLLGVTSVRTLVSVALVSAVLVHLSLITLLGSKLPRGWLLEQISPSEVTTEPVKAGRKK